MANASEFGKDAPPSAVALTSNVGRTNSMTGSAGKVFREFKWGLLTLFLLMVVVVGLVYDGGRNKKSESEKSKVIAELSPDINFDSESSMPPLPPESSNVVSSPEPLPRFGQALQAPAPLPVPYIPAPQDYAAPSDVATNFDNDPGIPFVPLWEAAATERTRIQARAELQPRNEAQPRTTEALTDSPLSEKTYKVKSGDTLTRIASSLKLGKGGLKALLDSNRDVLPDPNRLKVGMTLKVPVSAPKDAPKKAEKVAEMAREIPAAPKSLAQKNAQDEYVVQSGDTLERIARKLFNDGRRWRDIYEWNRDQLSDPGRLKLGQTLRIKGADSVKISSTRAEKVVQNEAENEVSLSSTDPQIEEPKVEVMSRPVQFSDVP